LLRQYGQKELNKNICQEKNTGTSGAAHAKTGLKRFRPPLPCCCLAATCGWSPRALRGCPGRPAAL